MDLQSLIADFQYDHIMCVNFSQIRQVELAY